MPTKEIVAQHTAGPWTVSVGEQNGPGVGVYGCVYGGPDEMILCDIWADGGDEQGLASQAPANARLIAAAPDLLDACRELVVAVSAAMRVIADLDAMTTVGAAAATREQRLIVEMKISGVLDGVGVRADAAIAKAEGTR